MLEQVPNFDDESLASLLKDLYGLEGEIATLSFLRRSKCSDKNGHHHLCAKNC